MADLTLQDVFNRITECAKNTDDKIEHSLMGIKNEVTELKNEAENNKIKVTELEKNVEILKQEKLKNNVRISGIPAIKIDPISLVYNICNLLDIEITDDEFVAYKTKTANFIIIQFENYRKKSTFLRKISDKKSIMAEEIFDDVTSNSQIYANDQLTPYFAKLFHLARMAKRDGKIYLTSSRGGKIRIKTKENSPFQFIFCEHDLLQLINNDTQQSNNSASTSTQDNNNNNKSPVTNKHQKRKAEEDNINENSRDKLKKTTNKNIRSKTKTST